MDLSSVDLGPDTPDMARVSVARWIGTVNRDLGHGWRPTPEHPVKVG
jgi:hypothetical protein